MKKAGLLVVCIMASMLSFSQQSDIISVQKKNGRVVRNFSAGSPISLKIINGSFIEGYIDAVRNDSVFITSYEIAPGAAVYGVRTFDTLTRYHTVVGFQEIAKIKIYRKESFFRGLFDKLLMVGGAGYLALNLINSDYLKVPFDDPRTINTLIISAGAFATGFVLNKALADGRFTLKKHRIKYIRLR